MIRIENLSMFYGAIQALKGVRFTVQQGEVIGLLGPNGAGKSTTLKIMTSYVYPTQGTAYIAEKDVRTNPIEVRQKIGYLPEQLPLYMDMEVQEYLKFVGKARGLFGANLVSRTNWVVEKCGLKPMYHKIIRELSKGYRQRTALAQALIHDPEIVILDEPTSGLDPHQIVEIRALIKELASQKKTIVFSTHILQEVEAITNRIIIINRGQIVADGTIFELQRQAMKSMVYQLVLPSSFLTSSEQSQWKEEIQKIEGIEGILSAEKQGEEAIVTLKASLEKDPRAALFRTSHEKGWGLLELRKKPFSLEEVFLSLTEPEKALVDRKGERT